MSSDKGTSGSQTSLREANRARILDAVRHYGGLTQVELAANTGLSAATVSTIVKELTTAGLVTITPTSRSGRRALYVTLARQSGLVAGVQIGHRHLEVNIADFSATVVADQRMPLPLDHRSDTGMDRATLIISDLVDSIGATLADLSVVGLAMPAPINPETGKIAIPGLLPGWDGVDISGVMSRRLGRPVLVDNEANLAALAEFRVGAGRGADSSVYIFASHGIGAGVILDGQLIRGQTGMAGEIGHIRTDANGRICRCGNRGCLETEVSATALLELLRTSHGRMTFKDLINAAIAGDAGCRRVITDAGRYIGQAAAGLCGAINPQRVIVGGELSQTGDIFVEPLAEALARTIVQPPEAPVEVVQGELWPAAITTGAVILALDAVDLMAGLTAGTEE